MPIARSACHKAKDSGRMLADLSCEFYVLHMRVFPLSLAMRRWNRDRGGTKHCPELREKRVL